MPTLPELRCPGCGKYMDQVTAESIPRAEKYQDCLRKCARCLIGATNAKNPAKVKYLNSGQPQDNPPTKP